MTTQAPQVPALVTLPAVDLVAAGTWQLSTGEATFTTQDLADAVDAAQCPAIGAPRIKIGHTDERFTGDGEPAIGRVINMGLTAEGSKLQGDLAWMPGWLGTIAASAFPQRSIEGAWNVVCQIGHLHPFVISAVALLGVTGPGVGVLDDLDDIAALYGVSAGQPPLSQGERWTLQAASGGHMPKVRASATTTEDVRRAYYGSDVSWTMWVTEIQLDPPQLIVCDESTNDVFRVPYEAGENGAVTFGDPVKVLVEYVDAPADSAAAAAGRAAVAAGFRAMVAAAAADPEQKRVKAEARAARGTPPADPPPAPQPDAEAGGPHGSFSGTHSHPHSTGGSQGDDASHEHEHSHDGDATHSHEHASAAASTKGADVDFTADQLKALRDKLGKGDDDEITPDELIEFINASGTTAAGRRQALPPGVMVVEAEAWKALGDKVEAGEKREKKRQVAERDQVLAEAVRAGKFSRVRVEHWARLWDADPEGTREVLASLQKNVVPVTDIGAAGNGSGLDDVDEEYANVFGNPAKA